ncbi:MAG: hypothetical protein EA381_11800 [Planctomycetaceae bacterium]|nr:MAG: hypothetical protein EA381_11800 [Planctomycetaceae bacterium]
MAVPQEFRSVLQAISPRRGRRLRRRLKFQGLEKRLPLASDIDVCFPLEPAASNFSVIEDDVPPLIGPMLPESPAFTLTQLDDSILAKLADAVSARGGAMPAASADVEGALGAEGEGPAAAVVSHSPFDPSGDGLVTPLDALQVLTHLSVSGSMQSQPDPATLKRFDINEDGVVSTLDALLLLNEMSRATLVQSSPLAVPLVRLDSTPLGVAASIRVDSLAMRLHVPPQTQRVYASVPLAGGGERVGDLSDLIRDGAVQLTHAEAIGRLNPAPNLPLRWSFWTEIPNRIIRSRVELTWEPPAVSPPPVDGLLWSEDAESANPRIIDQSDPRFPLVQSTVASQGNRAFHLTHPEQNPNGFVIDRTILIQANTKLFFMSRTGWSTSKQYAKVLVSTDLGATWPHQVYFQPGSNGPGDTAFSLKQVDLSAFAGQNVRIRFLYDYQGGGRYPGTDLTFGWVIDDIQIGSEFRKMVYSIGNPTAQEQSMLEYINRARADAIVEANRLANENDPHITHAYGVWKVSGTNLRNQYATQVNSGFFVRNAQPLSFNSALGQAARGHSQDMLSNRFQGHQSSSGAPHPFRAGFTARDRAAAFGYQGGVSENVFAYGESIRHAHASFTANWGPDNSSHADYNPAFRGQGMQNPSIHRRNIHRGTFNEVGVGIVSGSNGGFGPQVVTLNFGTTTQTYVTGVAYRDSNGNSFYDVGEGLGGLRVDVEGSPYYAMTTASGGYSVPVTGDGRYLVTFSSNGVARYSTVVDVHNGRSVKVDYRTA